MLKKILLNKTTTYFSVAHKLINSLSSTSSNELLEYEKGKKQSKIIKLIDKYILTKWPNTGHSTDL